VSKPLLTSESSSARGGYPATLERDVASSDGQFHFRLRPIRSDDGPGLVAFHDHLSDRSCYLRFFSLHPHLSPKEVERFTHVDYENRLALVAVLDDHLIGVGRYDRRPHSEVAEVAFVVADDYQHRGVASLLLDELVSAARDRHISSFVAETLHENRSMLDVFFHSGFDVKSHYDYGEVSLSFPLESTPRYEDACVVRQARWHVERSDEGDFNAQGAVGGRPE
jgi:GNAT superfamily N-acetyltransferase